MTDLDKRIKIYIENNTERISGLTALEISAHLDTTTTSVNRVAKKMGFKHFTDLKYHYIVNKEEDEIDKNINKDINLPKIIEIYSELKSSDKVFIYGVGSSNISCKILLFLMLSVLPIIPFRKFLLSINTFKVSGFFLKSFCIIFIIPPPPANGTRPP